MSQTLHRAELHRAVEELPESELAPALRFLKFLTYAASEEEPIDAETSAMLDSALLEKGERVALEELRSQLRK